MSEASTGEPTHSEISEREQLNRDVEALVARVTTARNLSGRDLEKFVKCEPVEVVSCDPSASSVSGGVSGQIDALGRYALGTKSRLEIQQKRIPVAGSENSGRFIAIKAMFTDAFQDRFDTTNIELRCFYEEGSEKLVNPGITLRSSSRKVELADDGRISKTESSSIREEMGNIATERATLGEITSILEQRGIIEPIPQAGMQSAETITASVTPSPVQSPTVV